MIRAIAFCISFSIGLALSELMFGAGGLSIYAKIFWVWISVITYQLIVSYAK